MPMPTTASKANCDSSTDDPKLALLTDLATLIDKFNELLAMRGVASGLCDLDANTAVPAARLSKIFPAGTLMLFAQTAAPTGWTKSTAHNNKALRLVSGTASSGGTVAFTTAFASKSVAGTVGATTLTESQIPSHTHTTPGSNAGDTGTNTAAVMTDPSNLTMTSGATGGGASHTHSFSGTAIDMAVQYVDVIIAAKD